MKNPAIQPIAMAANSAQKPYTEDGKEPQNEKRTLHIIEEFMENTTAHGWGHAVRSHYTPIRALWVLLTLVALFFNMAHVSVLTMQYLQYPYEQVSRVEVDQIAFPSVSICNIQAFSTTSAKESLSNTSSRFSQWNNTTNYFFNNMLNYSGNDYESRLLYERLRGARGFYENIGDEVKTLGHQPQDFILSCLYALQPCTWRNFTQIESATYYNCYTFNGGNMSKEKLMTQMTGPQAGLSLILYLESDNGDFQYDLPYYTFLSVGNAAGVRVVIHSPDTYPSPIDKGFDVPPGFSSSVGVDVSRHSRLGEPYSKCRKNPKTAMDDNYLYSEHECTMSCQQQMIMTECGCIASDLPHLPQHLELLPYCGYFNVSEPTAIFERTECESRTTLNFLTNEGVRSNCSCYAPCLEYEYSTDVSYSYWPIDYSQETFFEHYVTNHEHRDSLKAWQNLQSFNLSSLIFYGLIRKNFVRLNVYIKSLVIHEYMQKGSYTFFNLFSDIGGTFGLWIGMSLLTWGEVIELCIRMFIRWLRKIFNIPNKRIASENEDTNKHNQVFL